MSSTACPCARSLPGHSLRGAVVKHKPKQAILIVTDDQAFHDLLFRLVNDGKMSASDLPNIPHSVVDSPSRGFTKHETVRTGSSIDECQALLVVTSPKCEPL